MRAEICFFLVLHGFIKISKLMDIPKQIYESDFEDLCVDAAAAASI